MPWRGTSGAGGPDLICRNDAAFLHFVQDSDRLGGPYERQLQKVMEIIAD